MNIFLFDPSMQDQSGTPSTNLGDLIIRRSMDAVIAEVFPDAVIIAASTHTPLSQEQIGQALAADLVLVGGTNILSSHLLEYDQWELAAGTEHYATPIALRTVLLGVGWWQYQDTPDILTRNYYNQILHGALLHSVRDEYTKAKLAECGIDNVVNTSCPTLWTLDGRSGARRGSKIKCLFCLTDYKQDVDADNAFVNTLLERYNELVFFPQGAMDLEYAAHVPAIVSAGPRVTILPNDIRALYDAGTQGDCDYIGTRLHAGAACLQSGLSSLILAVDNRSLEIAKDIDLPVVDRTDMDAVRAWIDGTFPEKFIHLPKTAIAEWKTSIRAYAETVDIHRENQKETEKYTPSCFSKGLFQLGDIVHRRAWREIPPLGARVAKFATKKIIEAKPSPATPLSEPMPQQPPLKGTPRKK